MSIFGRRIGVKVKLIGLSVFIDHYKSPTSDKKQTDQFKLKKPKPIF